MKYTKISQIAAELKVQIQTNPNQCKKALLKVYERQTEDEQDTKTTRHKNKKGFRQCDAYKLSDMAQTLLAGKNLTEEQMKVASVKMPIYAKQLVRTSIAEGKIKRVGREYIFVK